MDTEREALLVVREVVTRRLVTVMDVRSRFEEWRQRRSQGVEEEFIDFLVARGTLAAAHKQRIVIALAMADHKDAKAEENIRTMVLGTPAPTPPPATTPAPAEPRRSASGRIAPPAMSDKQWGEAGASASRRVARPSSHEIPAMRAPGSTVPGSNTPGPAGATPPPAYAQTSKTPPEAETEGEVELVTPGGVPVGLEPPVGTRLGTYELLEVVGRGGMGTVFKARVHPSLEVVAVKVLGGSDRKPSSGRRARFRREILATARLNHPNVVRVRDAGHAGPVEFMAMELVEGDDLERALASGKLALEERMSLGAQVVAGVAHAHERGVIHRDLKPQNVLLDSNGVPKVVDFGLAKIEEEDNRLTRTGSALGTPFYMAPEQFTGASTVDARADVFSLGVLLYELLTTERPFKGVNAVEVADRVRNHEPTAPSYMIAGIPKSVDAVIARAMAKKPDERYANAGELHADLEKARAGEQTQARAPGPTQKIAKAAGAYRAPAIGFFVACLLFIPLVFFAKGRSGGEGPVPVVPAVPVVPPGPGPTPQPGVPLPPAQPPGPGPVISPTTPPTTPPAARIEPGAQSAIEKARAALDAVPPPAALDLSSEPDETANVAVELELAWFAPISVGDLARARAGVEAAKAISPGVRAELLRELSLLDKLRALVLCFARLDPGALGDRIDAWGGARDIGRYPRVLDDETLDLRAESHVSCVRPLALASETLAHATGDDSISKRALAVLAVARGEPLPTGLRAEDAKTLLALASWREGARGAVKAARERTAKAEWDALLREGDPEAWATRAAGTAFFAEQRRAWTLLAAERLGVEKLLGATLDTTQNRVRWEAHFLGFDVAFVATSVRIDRGAEGLDLAGVRLRLDAGKARGCAAVLDGVKGHVTFALGRHVLLLDGTTRPNATVGGVEVGGDDTRPDWSGVRRLDATFFERDPTRVVDQGSPVVIFKLDKLRLAKVPLDTSAPPSTPTIELSLEDARLRSLEVTAVRGAIENALPKLAGVKLPRLVERRSESGRVLRDETDRLAGLRLEGRPGTWKTLADGALEATGPARLVALVPVDAGAAVLGLDASPGVSLGFGEPGFAAPATAKGTYRRLSLVAGPATDGLTVDELLRVAAPRTKGPRSLVIDVAAGARAAVKGLKILAD